MILDSQEEKEVPLPVPITISDPPPKPKPAPVKKQPRETVPPVVPQEVDVTMFV